MGDRNSRLGRMWHWLVWLVWRPLTAPFRWGQQWRRRRRAKASLTAVLTPASTPPSANPTNRLLALTAVFSTLALIALAAYTYLRPPELTPPVTIILTPTPKPTAEATIVQTAVPTQPSPLPTLLPTPTAAPTAVPLRDPLANGGSILFSLRRDGNEDIFLLPAGQPAPIRLTNHPAPDRDPAWRPDGQALAFSSQRDGNWEIYLYDLASDTLERVTQQGGFDGAPAWSPDGLWLVYESYRDDNFDIYLQKADLSEPARRLTTDTAADYAPVWSPDGRHIVFTSWRGGSEDLFVLSLDDAGLAAVNLTNTPNLHESEAAFAPNGRLLAYTQSDGTLPIINVQPVGADGRLLGAATTIGQQGQSPTWAPDSGSLLYVYQRGGQDYLLGGSVEAWGVVAQAYAPNGRLAHPDWSPTVVDPAILASLQSRLARRDAGTAAAKSLFTEALAPGPLALLFELPVNAPSPYLNDHVDQSFLALRERVTAEAGWDFLGQLDGLFVPLEAKPLPGQPLQNWSQAGRAFDVAYREALAFDPRLQVVREEVGGRTMWRLFVKTAVQDGTQGEPLRRLPWDFRPRLDGDPLYYDQGGKLREAMPDGYYIDFTALAAEYGWQRVAASDNWRTYFAGIQFWRFENRQDLSWPEAMRQLYDEAALAAALGEKWDQ